MKSRVFDKEKNGYEDILIVDSDISIPEKILDKWSIILDAMLEKSGFNYAFITKINSNNLEVLSSNSSIKGEVLFFDLCEGNFCETVMANRRNLYVPNTKKTRVWSNYTDMGILSYWGVCIMIEDKVFGTLFLTSRTPTDLSDNQVKQFLKNVEIIKNDIEYIIS